MQNDNDEKTETLDHPDDPTFPSIDEIEKDGNLPPGAFLSKIKGKMKRANEGVLRENNFKNPDVGFASDGSLCFRPPGGSKKISPPAEEPSMRNKRTPFLHCECYISFSLDSVGKTDFMTKLQYPKDEKYDTEEIAEPLFTVFQTTEFFNSYYFVVSQELIRSENNPAEWLVDLIYDNFEKISEHCPEKIVFTFSYERQDPCSMILRWRMTHKIAIMGADLCTSC